MENLTLEISNPETVHAIAAAAELRGTTPEDCALSLLESTLLAQRPFVELVEPLARSFDDSRMSEEEFDALVEQERQALWEEQHGASEAMDDQPPGVVFDCNVFLQGAVNRNSPARQALRLFFAGRITLFVSAAVLRELRDVLNRPTPRHKLPGLSDRLVDALLQKIESRAVLLANVPEEFHYERDPKDEGYVNLAIAANAIFLVSKDNDLLALTQSPAEDAVRFCTRYPFLRVLMPAEFVTEMERRGRRVEAADE